MELLARDFQIAIFRLKIAIPRKSYEIISVSLSFPHDSQILHWKALIPSILQSLLHFSFARSIWNFGKTAQFGPILFIFEYNYLQLGRPGRLLRLFFFLFREMSFFGCPILLFNYTLINMLIKLIKKQQIDRWIRRNAETDDGQWVRDI